MILVQCIPPDFRLGLPAGRSIVFRGNYVDGPVEVYLQGHRGDDEKHLGTHPTPGEALCAGLKCQAEAFKQIEGRDV